MKARNFYPLQALRSLVRGHAGLSKGQHAALAFAMRKSRQM